MIDTGDQKVRFMDNEPRTECTLEYLRGLNTPGISLQLAAKAFGCDPRTVSTGIKEGTIPAIRLGKKIIIPREKFLKLFEVEDD